MNPKYIVFQDVDDAQRSAVWYIGHQPHAVLWEYLHKKNPVVFARPLSAGYSYFNIKTKKFVATGDSSTLSLVPLEGDDKILQATLAHNDKLQLIVTDLGQAPDFGFLLGSTEDLLATYFDQSTIFGEGKATFRIQDSARPFKFTVDEVKGTIVVPQYLNYIEDRLFA